MFRRSHAKAVPACEKCAVRLAPTSACARVSTDVTCDGRRTRQHFAPQQHSAAPYAPGMRARIRGAASCSIGRIYLRPLHQRARARPYRTEAPRAASADAADDRGAARSCTAARAAAASGDCGAMQFLLAATHFTIVHPCRSLLILSRRHSAVPCRCRPLRRFMLVRLAVERT